MTPDAGRFFLYLLIGQLGIFASVSFLILISALGERVKSSSQTTSASLSGEYIQPVSKVSLEVCDFAAPRIAVAQAVAPMLLVVLLLVCGFYIREQDIPVSRSVSGGRAGL